MKPQHWWAGAVRFLHGMGRVPYPMKTAMTVFVMWTVAAVVSAFGLVMDLIFDDPDWWLLIHVIMLAVDLAGARFGLRKLAEAKERRRFARIVERLLNE